MSMFYFIYAFRTVIFEMLGTVPDETRGTVDHVNGAGQIAEMEKNISFCQRHVRK